MAERCLIVDDSEAFLSSASALLGSQGMTIVGCAHSSAEALRVADEVRPSVVLVDVELGDEDGLELARGLATRHPDISVVLVSANELDGIAELVAQAGANGFLSKAALSTRAVEALCGRRGT